MPDRFDSREDITFDPNHPSFVRGGEAWAHGAPLTENPFERWEYNWKAWNAGGADADGGWQAERALAANRGDFVADAEGKGGGDGE